MKATCGTGSQGCAGTAVATAGDVNLGTVPFNVKEEATATISFPGALPPGTKEITVDFTTSAGVAGSDSVTIPVLAR